ncbi:8-oxoguanine DNA glycosylase OGG fold protein [Arthrobacter rhombi]|uniref:8-oxoguanine DNA glycosylase OGG fold protein n=1 Tax=Arthrobacter rhombi TaxID=71253 RepID=UPI003FCEEFEC
MTTPKRLTTTLDRWVRAGRPIQVASRWNTATWSRQFPAHQAFFDGLKTDRLNRHEAVQHIGRINNETEAVEAFLLAMLWGYGPVGYGAFRTRRILDEPGAYQALLEVAQTAQTEGGLEAFNLICARRDQNRGYLKWLGPAFGTKFLYFATAAVAPQQATPVMDAVVRRWFAKHAPDHQLIVDVWHQPSYKVFLDCLEAWSSELTAFSGETVTKDEVEYLIFADGNNFENNAEWRESWDVETLELPVSELIDQLRARIAAEFGDESEAMKSLDDLECKTLTISSDPS